MNVLDDSHYDSLDRDNQYKDTATTVEERTCHNSSGKRPEDLQMTVKHAVMYDSAARQTGNRKSPEQKL